MNRVQILHLNVGKTRIVQNSLLNDTSLKDFSAISVIEPYIYANPDNNKPTIPHDYRWHIFQPTTKADDALPRHAFRSAIWINTKVKATEIPVECHDTPAVVLHIDHHNILLVACYDPRNQDTKEGKTEELERRIDNIKRVKTRAEERAKGKVDTIICADLNRYHPIWGGQDTLQHQERVREGGQIVRFMHEESLQSLLKQGTITWEHPSLDYRSTIDLVLGSKEIQEKLLACKIHPVDHGSDHKARLLFDFVTDKVIFCIILEH